MRRRCRVVDPTTSVALADGPLIIVLAVAIVAVWVVRTDAPALRVRTGVNGGVPSSGHATAARNGARTAVRREKESDLASRRSRSVATR